MRKESKPLLDKVKQEVEKLIEGAKNDQK